MNKLEVIERYENMPVFTQNVLKDCLKLGKEPFYDKLLKFTFTSAATYGLCSLIFDLDPMLAIKILTFAVATAAVKDSLLAIFSAITCATKTAIKGNKHVMEEKARLKKALDEERKAYTKE